MQGTISMLYQETKRKTKKEFTKQHEYDKITADMQKKGKKG